MQYRKPYGAHFLLTNYHITAKHYSTEMFLKNQSRQYSNNFGLYSTDHGLADTEFQVQ